MKKIFDEQTEGGEGRLNIVKFLLFKPEASQKPMQSLGR
jgi:hypothetical protein